MKPADKLVEALLGDEDPKDFIDRQADFAFDSQVIVALDGVPIPRNEIDGIEAYGMVMDGEEVVDRAEAGEACSRYGVSVHKLGGGLYDIGEYDRPEAALAAAAKLQELLPHVQIFIDEISPA